MGLAKWKGRTKNVVILAPGRCPEVFLSFDGLKLTYGHN
jgi:hypothetical protein